MRELERRTSGGSSLAVNICVDYSGQWDIAQVSPVGPSIVG